MTAVRKGAVSLDSKRVDDGYAACDVFAPLADPGSLWREGFAHGWAMRDQRDVEPTRFGAVVRAPGVGVFMRMADAGSRWVKAGSIAVWSWVEIVNAAKSQPISVLYAGDEPSDDEDGEVER